MTQGVNSVKMCGTFEGQHPIDSTPGQMAGAVEQSKQEPGLMSQVT